MSCYHSTSRLNKILPLFLVLIAISVQELYGTELSTLKSLNLSLEIDQASSLSRDAETLDSLNSEAADLIHSGDLTEAKVLIDESIGLADIIRDDEGKAYAYSNLGSYYLTLGTSDSVVVYLEEIYRELLHTDSSIRLGNILATAYRNLNQFEKALNLYHELLAQSEEQNDKMMQAAIMQNIASVNSSLDDIPSAIDHYLTSLDLSEELGDTVTVSTISGNIGLMMMDQEKYELAFQYLNRSLELAHEINHVNSILRGHNNFGIYYRNTKEYDLAIQSYTEAIELAEEIGNIFTPIQSRFNLGNIYLDLEDYDQALALYEESINLSKDYGIEPGIFYNTFAIGDMYYQTGEPAKAVEYLEDSLPLAIQMNELELIQEVRSKLITVYEELGDFEVAFSYLKKHSEVNDSIKNRERAEALARLETQLNLRTERANRELAEAALISQKNTSYISITLLFVIVMALAGLFMFTRKQKKVNHLLQVRTSDLDRVNTEKDKLLSILAHDLRAPLSNLQGVVYLIRDGILQNQDLDALMKQIEYQLNQGITTLSNYLQWAQNQKDGIQPQLRKIELNEIIREVTDEKKLSIENKKIDLDLSIHKNTCVTADPDLLKVIVRNLLSNAIKFVDDGGSISVTAEENSGRVQLSVKDNGVGIVEEKQATIFNPFQYSSRGTIGEVGTGLGLSICKDFTELQGGKIELHSETGKGSIFTITLNTP